MCVYDVIRLRWQPTEVVLIQKLISFYSLHFYSVGLAKSVRFKYTENAFSSVLLLVREERSKQRESEMAHGDALCFISSPKREKPWKKLRFFRFVNIRTVNDVYHGEKKLHGRLPFYAHIPIFEFSYQHVYTHTQQAHQIHRVYV